MIIVFHSGVELFDQIVELKQFNSTSGLSRFNNGIPYMGKLDSLVLTSYLLPSISNVKVASL